MNANYFHVKKLMLINSSLSVINVLIKRITLKWQINLVYGSLYVLDLLRCL